MKLLDAMKWCVVLAVALFIASAYWGDQMPDEKPVGTLKKSAVRYSLRTPDQTSSGKWELRARTVDVPPKYLTCTQFGMVDDSLDVQLTPAGRALFDKPDDVAAALSLAVAEAVNESLIHGSYKLCDGECRTGPIGAGSETPGDSAIVAVSITKSDMVVDDKAPCSETDPPMTEDEYLHSGSGIHVTVTADGAKGVDFRSLLGSLRFEDLTIDDSNGAPPGTAAAIKGALIAARDYMLEHGTIATTIITTGQPQASLAYSSFSNDGVNFSSAYVTIYKSSDGRGYVTFEANYGAETIYTCSFESASGNLILGDTLHVIGKTAESIDWDIQNYFWTTTPDNVFNDSYSVTNREGSPVTIELYAGWFSDGKIPESPHETYRIYPDVAPGSGNDNFAVSGAFLQTLTPDNLLLDPGFKSACQWDFTYANRRPFLQLCDGNEMQLQVNASPGGFVHPLGRFPHCKTTLSPVRTGGG